MMFYLHNPTIYKCDSVSNDTCKNEQYSIEKMQLTDAWNLSKGNHSLKVGVIDSGIDKIIRI